MDLFTVQSGELSVDLFATSPQEAARLALEECPPGVKLGVLLAVSGGEAEEVYFSTRQLMV